MALQTPVYERAPQSSSIEQLFAQFLTATYAWMAAGLSASALTALAVASSPAMLTALARNPMLPLVLIVAQVGLVVVLTRQVTTLSQQAAGALFLAYSVLSGVSLSSLFLLYTRTSLVNCFGTCAVSFVGLSLFGAVTKRSLSGLGQFCTFGMFGLMAALLLNLFMQSSAIQFISSCVGVLVFGGLIAYDTRQLRDMFMMTAGAGNLAIHGALMLYLDFINLFVSMVRLFGERRD